MAITSVTATLDNQTENLKSNSDGAYVAKLVSPTSYGDYLVSAYAYDDSGNVSVLSSTLTVSSWIDPKTDWKVTDRFNIVDYNRIRNNIAYLHNRASRLFGVFGIVDMGESIVSEEADWEVQYFNAFEDNIDIINQHIFTRDYGIKKVFFENGVFIDWQELNRIESASLSMKQIIDAQAEIIRNIPFRLGAYREVRI